MPFVSVIIDSNTLYQVSCLMSWSGSDHVSKLIHQGIFGGVVLLAACGPQRGERPTGPVPLGGRQDTEEKRFINAPGVGGLEGFTQAIKVGKRVYLSGQVGVDSGGTIAGSDLSS